MGEDASMDLRRGRALAAASLGLLLAAGLPACSSPEAPGTSRSAPSGNADTSGEPPTGEPPTGPEAPGTPAREELDPRQEVAQLFLVGVPLDDLGAGEDLVTAGVGGLFL